MAIKMPPPSPSIRSNMPQAKIELGKFVTLRPRKDGTFRVFLQVPARLAPSGWPSLIPLPTSGPRTGDLTDLEEVARIRDEAFRLYQELQARRGGTTTRPEGRSFRSLIRVWQKSNAWANLRPKSQIGYTTVINHILAWSDACTPAPDPAKLTRSQIETMLSLFDDRPTTKVHVRKVLNILFSWAIAENWRADNPCLKIKLARPDVTVGIWEQADVDVYVETALAMGHDGVAEIILLEWEIGQRLTDARGFRAGKDYDSAAGVFRFHQSKTNSYVTLPVSARLRTMLQAKGNQLFMFLDSVTHKAFESDRLSHVFAQVRTAAVERGARPLLLKWLRHSCVVQLARAGCSIPEIASITGHSLQSAEKILQRYLPRDNAVAWEAQRKRGLI